MSAQQDMWAEWLLKRRFAGDADRAQQVLDFLYPVRDKVLEHARLEEGEVLLDVGCGDGLIAFGALQRAPLEQVIFSDISQDLLDHARKLAEEMGLLSRCRFLHASADDLAPLDDGSVDAVTTRSVLIYVENKQQAFDEFYRVLRPGGRLSIFEPINRFGSKELVETPHLFWGYDVTAVQEIAAKIKELYLRLQPLESDPMLNFDERDLLARAERTGFKELHLELNVEIKPQIGKTTWEQMLHAVPNPKTPSLAEAMERVLSPEETEHFSDHLRPLVDAGQAIGRTALAYLWVVK